MATLMDQIMGRTDPRDFTLGSRATFQPDDQPFSRNGTLGNMGMRGMQNAQQRLAAAGVAPALPLSATNSPYGQLRPSLPAARPEVPVDTLGTMTGFMPPAELPPAARLPQLPTPFQLGMPRGVAMPSVMPVPPPGVMGMAPLGGFTPMAPSPMNITPPLPPPRPAAPASGFVAPANVPLPPPRPADMSVRESFMQRLLGNPTQSNSMPVLPAGATLPSQVNWGDAENPADFFRASQALQGLLG